MFQNTDPDAAVRLERALDRAIERNAVVIVVLRHAIAELHALHADRALPWQRCSEDTCNRAALALGEQRSR